MSESRVLCWYGYEYHDPILNEAVLWQGEYCNYDDNEQEKYYAEMETKHLIALAKFADHADQTDVIITELYKREPAKAIELAHAILEKGKGDDWLHEWTIKFLTEHGETIGKIKRPVLFGPYDDDDDNTVIQESTESLPPPLPKRPSRFNRE